MVSREDDRGYQTLELRLRAMLPEEYQDTYEELEPVPMRAAGLRYDEHGDVAWDEIWSSFCDLAMAGGPPHKGKLLGPGSRRDIDAQPVRYRRVSEEICRGVELAAELAATPAANPGWVDVQCHNDPMAGWLLRAITMENVAVRATGSTLQLPAGPHYRLEKEIKNVITVIAKTSHYWLGHIPRAQQDVIACLFAETAEQEPLVEPSLTGDEGQAARLDATLGAMRAAITRGTGLSTCDSPYPGWLGVECSTVRAAVWLMRTMVVSNVLARREDTLLYVPVNPTTDGDGTRVARTLTRAHRFALARGVIGTAT